MEGVEGVAFEAVVEVDEGGLARGGFVEGGKEGGAGGAGFVVDGLGFVVGAEGVDGFLVGAAGGEEETGGGEVA